MNQNLEPDRQRAIFKAAVSQGCEQIRFPEFVSCIIAFALEPTPATKARFGATRARITESTSIETIQSETEEEEEEEDMPEDLADLDPAEQQWRLKVRAFLKLALGTGLVLLFTDPMCDLLTVMGEKLHISSFYVAFVLAPLAANASELVAAMKMASKKTIASMVSALSSLTGAAIMNNTFVLSIFMILIVTKKLAWKFSAETLSILFVELFVGIIAITCERQTLLHAIGILTCYPLSLVLVKFLTDVVHLD